MYAALLADARFHELLLAIDGDLADTCRAEGCRHCNGRLHSARYPRQPRRPKGAKLGREHDLRFSFCCAAEGCRGRETPPSVRFLGRRVYLAAIVVLVAMLRDGITPARLERLSEIVTVNRRTVARWRLWWGQTLPATPFWRGAGAQLMPPVDPSRLPTSLLDRFAGGDADRLVALLRFLGPITGGSGRIGRAA